MTAAQLAYKRLVMIIMFSFHFKPVKQIYYREVNKPLFDMKEVRAMRVLFCHEHEVNVAKRDNANVLYYQGLVKQLFFVLFINIHNLQTHLSLFIQSFIHFYRQHICLTT